MIVTDLDRTLLRTDKMISGHTADVLNRCHARGIKIVFATARPKRTVLAFTEAIPADCLICHNGAVAFLEGIPMFHHGIEPAVTVRILKNLQELFLNPMLSVEIADTLYANFDVSALWNNIAAIQTDFSDLPRQPADKILVGISDMRDLEKIEALLSKERYSELYVEGSDGTLGLILNRYATKWNAIKTLAEHWGIAVDQIAAFGDDMNDIKMLQNCGVGVVVANALEEAKAAADVVCASNDEDGVAMWLEGNVLKNGGKYHDIIPWHNARLRGD
jgi:Cof subfamily protein (haloacid dehalogenase superfamily)